MPTVLRNCTGIFLAASAAVGVPAQTAQKGASGAARPSASSGAQPISRQRFTYDMDAQFRLKDANRDGFLSRGEIEAAERSRASADAQAQNRALFAKLDFDRNGVISPAEFTRLTPAPEPVLATPMLNRMDANRDQKVSLVEHRAATLVNFDALDADKDGVVSPAEMKPLKR